MRLSGVISNFFIFFLRENFTSTKSTKTHTSEQKQKKAAFLCAQNASKEKVTYLLV